ncbi:hypothetical protein ACIGEZ_02605 [Streptomyces sp. NPDC085481]|uniref:effector-associated constant component EACC1 n=1 Tax=Streptomyces sp. NPDC085481 TaxID=3365727 RepID=UPI0037D9334C
MRTVITVHAEGEGADGAHELRRWLSAEPALRGRIRAGADEAVPEPGAMGVGADALLALLAPGGVAAVFAGAVVAWAQTRRGSQTITITRPDGTEITIASDHVRGLDARQSADLARTLAAELSRPAAETRPGAEPGTGGADGAGGAAGAGSGTASGAGAGAAAAGAVAGTLRGAGVGADTATADTATTDGAAAAAASAAAGVDGATTTGPGAADDAETGDGTTARR